MIEGVADGDLVRRIAGVDAGREAETELCKRFAPRVRRYGLRHLRSEDRASDLVQGVLLAMVEATRAGRIIEPDHVDRFVLGACRNIAQRVRQREDRARRLEEVDPAGVDAPDLERVDPAALGRCMGLLDGRSRTVVDLSYTTGSGAEEIAKIVETSVGNVRVIRHRALAQLRRCLAGRGI